MVLPLLVYTLHREPKRLNHYTSVEKFPVWLELYPDTTLWSSTNSRWRLYEGPSRPILKKRGGVRRSYKGLDKGRSVRRRGEEGWDRDLRSRERLDRTGTIEVEDEEMGNDAWEIGSGNPHKWEGSILGAGTGHEGGPCDDWRPGRGPSGETTWDVRNERDSCRISKRQRDR